MLSENVKTNIYRIAHQQAIRLRRADNIDNDPEGQRMKAVIADACFETYRFAVPQDDGNKVSVTEAPGASHG